MKTRVLLYLNGVLNLLQSGVAVVFTQSMGVSSFMGHVLTHTAVSKRFDIEVDCSGLITRYRYGWAFTYSSRPQNRPFASKGASSRSGLPFWYPKTETMPKPPKKARNIKQKRMSVHERSSKGPSPTLSSTS